MKLSENAPVDVFGDPFSAWAEDYLDTETTADWAALAASPLQTEERARLAHLWTQHARDEHRAMLLFARLASEMAALQMPLATVAACHRMVRDELRHTALCLRVVQSLAGTLPALSSPPDPRTSLDPHSAVAEGVLVGMYLAETVSLHIISTARKRESNPELRAVMQAILSDESRHSRFGLAWLEQYWRHWPEEAKAHATRCLPVARERLQEGLPDWLADAVRTALGTVVKPQLAAIGIECE